MSGRMSDAQARLNLASLRNKTSPPLHWRTSFFADDTLVICSCGKHAEECMSSIEDCGREYGLQIRWGKVQLVDVCTEQALEAPRGAPLTHTESMVDLGSTLHASGKYCTEVARRIGCATADFRTVSAVWKHASISKTRKFEIVDAIIISESRYSTASARPAKRDLRKLDGFQWPFHG